MTTEQALAKALQCQQSGQFAEAEALCWQILGQEPANITAWHLLGNLALDLRQHDMAVQCLEKAVDLRPDYVEAYVDLGTAYKAQGRLDKAISSYRRALALRPTLVVALNNLGNALKAAGQFDEAVAALSQATKLDPMLAEAQNNLGLAFLQKGDLPQAMACFERAIKLKPKYFEAFNNLGLAYRDLGRQDDAANCFRRCASLNPRHADGRFNRAMHWLLLGDYARGWPEYEFRWQRIDSPPRGAPELMWDGRQLAGQRLLLHAEQGLGDTIQFARYAQLAKERGATVVFATQKLLVPLMSRCLGIDDLTDLDSPPPPFDFHAPLLSLPGIFSTTLDTIPANVPYLSPDPALASHWSQYLAAIPSHKIGIAWQGSPTFREDRHRSFRLVEFAPVAALPDVTLISLQKGPGAEQLRNPSLPFRVVSLANDLDEAAGAFMDTAAIMKNLDLVITSDTAVAHLAGALGVPAWVALPFVPDWRWLLNRTDSPWYPTMRLFRQKSRGDWSSVFQGIATAVRERLNK